MKKFCPRLIPFLVVLSFFVFSGVSLAANLSLTSIGALDTQGKTYPEWWYTGTKPVLQGTAESGAAVTVTVGENSQEVTADESGNWSFYSDALVEGDHNVSITSGESSYSFVLHLGQTLPSNPGGTSVPETTQSTTPVPETGIPQLVALVVGVGALALGWHLQSGRRAEIRV